MGMNGISGTAYFQFCPSTLRLSQRLGMTMALHPAYAPFMPSSAMLCTMEQMNAGK